jgi:signal transduction histidine kinase/ActR/RegA family two-component response regulator
MTEVRLPLYRRAPNRHVIPYLVLLISVLASSATAYFMARAASIHERGRFDSAARDAHSAIQTRIETYLALLRSACGLFGASDEVRRDEFEAFADRLDLRRRYPGIQGIGYSARIRAGELPAFVAWARRQGIPGFHVWPETPRPEYHSIIYLEPLDRRNEAAIGYDMFTEPTRRAAMERAAATGLAAASGRVTLVQEIESRKQPGFLIYLPVYAKGMPTGSTDQRLAALRGFVYSPFRAGDLLSNLFVSDQEPVVDVQVYDLHAGRKASLLFDSRSGDAGFEPRFTRSDRIEVASRPWTLVVTSRPLLEQSAERRMAWWTFFTGLALSVALFGLLRSEVTARDAAEHAADTLQQSQDALHSSARELERVVAAEREAHAEAAEANRLKDEFLATLSHELRTPLGSILGWATMLRQGRLAKQQQERALDVIERNARSLAELVDDLLEVSRIVTGKLHLDPRIVDIAPSIEAALDAVRPMADAKGVVLEWRPRSLGRVFGDPDRIQQVAWNLLSNAIKFTPSGGRVVAVLDEEHREVVLTVADTGIGIAPAFLPHVFERFRQADSSTARRHGGMGLGLAIVRHLVEAQGGTVSVESAGEGAGAAFTVRLPSRRMASEERAARDGSEPNRGKDNRPLGDARVLVVDDEPDARDLVGAVVESGGGRPVLSASAADALDALRSGRFDLIIADIGMPGVDGLDFMRAVRALPGEAGGQVPALALTAYGRAEDRLRALDAGYQAHMVKPARPDDIMDAAAALIAGR